jgi:hypothetical protein
VQQVRCWQRVGCDGGDDQHDMCSLCSWNVFYFVGCFDLFQLFVRKFISVVWIDVVYFLYCWILPSIWRLYQVRGRLFLSGWINKNGAVHAGQLLPFVWALEPRAVPSWQLLSIGEHVQSFTMHHQELLSCRLVEHEGLP